MALSNGTFVESRLLGTWPLVNSEALSEVRAAPLTFTLVTKIGPAVKLPKPSRFTMALAVAPLVAELAAKTPDDT